jgi:hypothetical protein
MKKGTFQFSVTGVFIVLVLVSMVAMASTQMIADLSVNYGVPNLNNTEQFTTVTELNEQADNMRNAINFNKSSSWLDVIGGYFSAGIEAGKMSLSSVSLLSSDMDTVTDNFQEVNSLKAYVILIVIFGVVIGVIVAAMIKWRI